MGVLWNMWPQMNFSHNILNLFEYIVYPCLLGENESCNCVDIEYFDIINPLQPGVAFPYPLKHQKTLRFSDVFRGYR